MRKVGSGVCAGVLAVAVGACATNRRESVVLDGRQLHDFGSGPLTVTSASRAGRSQLVCYATSAAACPATHDPTDERSYVLFELPTDADRFKSDAVVPRGYHLCCGFAGPAGGQVTLALMPRTPVGVEPGPSSGAPADPTP
jgi:hypothetical protein